ncbi:hypothetical protein ABIE32_004348 [Comamonas sp. 4034]
MQEILYLLMLMSSRKLTNENKIQLILIKSEGCSIFKKFFYLDWDEMAF